MEKNVLELLEKSAVKYANKIAVKDCNGEKTFSELCSDSKKIGSALVGEKAFCKTIPVFMEKSILALETFWGITYAGGCYSLMNPAQPKERIEKILQVLNAPLLITSREFETIMKGFDFRGKILLAEDLILTDVDEDSLRQIRKKSIDTDPLYVNFTSGSTGIPKGVVVGHKSVIEFVHYFVSIFGIESNDIIGNQAPFDFDVSVKDIYSMLMTGATMYIIPKEFFAFPKKVLDILVEENITTLTWAVSALCMITSLKGFTYKIPTKVNKVMFSGEVMPINHLHEWMEALPHAMFANLYGPTEITCNCTYYIVKETCEKEIPIGKPFPNERVFLINEQNKEVTETGMEGEICVGGSTLALGYFGDKEKTQKVFVQNPLHNNYTDTIYRTGDIAYYREDGNLIYVGRRDFQIKHLGHRIELGEIETYLNAIPAINRACCLYDEQKQQIVVVYQGEVEKNVIKKELKKQLVKHMLPERYIAIDNIPMTENGKIDRKKIKKEYIGV